jgi:hypothetical protein
MMIRNGTFIVPLVLSIAACGGTLVAPGPDEGVSTPASARISTGRRTGEACAFAEQCGSRSCSAEYGSGTCGYCQDVRPLGATCGGNLQVCSYTATCIDGVCRTKFKDLGQACTLEPKGGSNCDSDLYCQPGAGSDAGPETRGVCRWKTPLGEACPEAGLARWFACAGDGTCVAGVCRERRSSRLGEDCSELSCEAGLACDEGNHRCVRSTRVLGSPCGLVGNHYLGGCPIGTICGNVGDEVRQPETCMALPRVGELCVRETCSAEAFCEDLYSGVAKPRRCVAKRSLGASCKYQEECGSDLECRSGTCQAACR